MNAISGISAAVPIGPASNKPAQPAMQTDAAQTKQSEPAPRYKIDPAMDFPVLIDDEDPDPVGSTPGYGVPMDGPKAEKLDLRIPVPDRIPDVLPPGQKPPE